ncbi:MAG: HEAT repeat domain-containing protein [Myxococcales bacterium]|nr:HEAT repeat domain-containing protein [Myxococcales bacterium]
MPEIHNIERLADGELAKLARSAEISDALLAVKHLERRASPMRAKVYEDLMKARQTQPKVKRTVASLAGMEATPASRHLLSAALADPDALVVRNAARSLGLIGGAAELQSLEQLHPAAQAQAAVEFAKCLISYRHRLGKHRLAVPDLRARVALRGGFELPAKPAAQGRAGAQEAQKDLPSLGVVDQGAVELDCKGVRLILAFTDDFPKQNAIDALAQKDARPLVLMHSGLSTGQLSLAHHFVTQPGAGGRIELIGARPGGEVTYAGSVKVTPAGVEFELHSLSTRYAAAIDFAGIYSPASGEWKFTRKLSGEQVADPRARSLPTATTKL